MKNLTLLLLVLLTGSSCNSTKKMAKAGPGIESLQAMMVGTFNSAEQAARDSAFFDITLHMYPIWTDKGHWLYVEQAVSAMQERPYRQRVYQLEQTAPGSFKSIVYTLPEPEAFIGAWKDPSRFDALAPDALELRAGCAVVLERQPDGSFTGSTQGNGCESTLRGASYATSRVSIRDGMIVSWDQGFNSAGEQVWGAVKGGYEFKKQ
ncbi:MAG: chromophore lyase CpcT/CpeT [Phaeodactylibacter sp.]|nr:chromophore lyase CpcT/CpeT [Phaeodactylibacter sp.]MCB9049582.1 chromophore lyase CpcT/CpeT [Lewinellaceae bacterium]